MKVYCAMVSLARANARRKLMVAEAERAGLAFDVVDAVDAAAFSEATLLRDCRREGPWGYFHTQNMACTLSHAAIWERFLARDEDLCLVIEDDVFLSPELVSWVADTGWWPKDADIVKLERWRDDRMRVILEDGGGAHLGRRVLRLLSRHPGSAGYMLTRVAATHLLAWRPYDLTIDQLLFNSNASSAARALVVYQVSPAMIVQGNEPPAAGQTAGTRHRPVGMTLLRHQLRRGYHELAYPMATLVKLLTRRARTEKISYVPVIADWQAIRT